MKGKLLLLLFLIPFVSLYSQPTPHIPKVSFLESSYGDYLYFLFNRQEVEQTPKLDSILGMQGIPDANSLLSLPEIATSARVTSYKEIYTLINKYYKNNPPMEIVKPYPKKLYYSFTWLGYDSLLNLVKVGEHYYPAFEKIWQQKIKPVEDAQIAEWEIQLKDKKVLEKLYSLTRLEFKTPTLDIACMAFHVAGSGNYSPAGIYSVPFEKANLGWFVGHEGTHLLVSAAVGNDWMHNKKATQLLQLAKSKDLNPNEIEETLCHFMQWTLSKAIGMTPSDKVINTRYSEGLRRNILARMESNWAAYLNSKENIIDFLIENALPEVQKYNAGDPI